MSSQTQGRRRMYMWGCLGLLAVAGILALLLVVLGIPLMRSRVRPLVGPGVSIRAPLNGARLALEHGAVVLMEARSNEPILRYELWVDGAREGVLRPAEGKPWLPDMAQIRCGFQGAKAFTS